MKRFIITLATLAVLSSLSFAQDGAALYKSKCAMCHGAAGEGKMGPSLQKTSMTEAQIAGFIAGQESPPHQGRCWRQRRPGEGPRDLRSFPEKVSFSAKREASLYWLAFFAYILFP